jgi:hypothetical protein
LTKFADVLKQFVSRRLRKYKQDIQDDILGDISKDDREAAKGSIIYSIKIRKYESFSKSPFRVLDFKSF